MARRASAVTRPVTGKGVRARLLSLVAAAALLPAVLAPPAIASKEGCAVVVIAGGISIRDLADPRLANISRLLREGSAGLMNVRTGRPTADTEPVERPGMLPGCLSLGAGAMASGGLEVSRAYDSGSLAGSVTAARVYFYRTGMRPPPGTVVHTEIVKMRRINESAAYRARPGLLGAALRRAGVRTFVFGNSDMPEEIHREAAAAAMDERGIVDGGTVSSPGLARRDPEAAYGVSCNVELLAKLAADSVAPKRFIVVDFGDTLRADFYGEYCTDEQAAALRRKAAARLDRLVGLVRASLDPERDLLILLSPCTRISTEFENERLAPVIISGPGYGSGLLSSPSTRRDGVVALTDIAPTVLASFGADIPAGMTGRRIHLIRTGTESLDYLLTLNTEAIRQADRLPVMRAGSVVQSIIVILATVALLAGSRGRLRRAALWAAVVPAVIPLAMLYLPAFYRGGLAGSAAALCGIAVLLMAALVLLVRSPARALMWTCGILVASILVDLARGASLIRWSIAGYSLVDGARYYGIGNELMGTVLGASIVFVGLACSLGVVSGRLRGVFAGTVFLIVFAFLGAPGLGAEAGGAIGAALAFVTAIVTRSTWRPSRQGILLIAAAAALGVGALFGLDALRGGGSQSHVGRALQLLASGDIRGVAAIATRKIGLNVMLLSTSLWSRLLFLSAAAAALLHWRGRRVTENSNVRREYAGALSGLAAGVVAAFLLNDSGVVAAAACAVLMWSLSVVKEDEQ